VNPLRLVVVARRFWPLLDEAEGLLAALVAELVRAGVRVTVVTARWHSDWPYQVDFHGANVVRLPFSNRRGWGTLRYMRALTHWLRGHEDQYDVAYICGLRHDAYAALAASHGGEIPMVLRVDRVGLTGECHWQLDAAFGHRIKKRCFQAAAFVAAGRTAERELIAAGYPREKIRYLPNGVPPAIARVSATRDAARAALAEAHPGLVLLENAPLAVYVGALHEEKGLTHLVAAWDFVRDRWPNARLWIVGEGSQAGVLSAQIAEARLDSWIGLPGDFDDDEDLLLAADVFVSPSLEESLCAPVLRAMAAGCPVVATDIPGHRELITHEQEGLLVPVEDPAALAAAISRIWQQPDLAGQLAEAARAKVAREFQLAEMVEAHLELFNQLARLRMDAVRP
jgi:glycosyltransferase involved in cell wall biosynthesis